MADGGPWFAAVLLVIAALYAAVGQAGATGYLAAMGVAGFDAAVMKPTALALNLVVAGIATVQFWRAGRVSWRTFYPFAVLGFPFSLLGGAVQLPERHLLSPGRGHPDRRGDPALPAPRRAPARRRGGHRPPSRRSGRRSRPAPRSASSPGRPAPAAACSSRR